MHEIYSSGIYSHILEKSNDQKLLVISLPTMISEYGPLALAHFKVYPYVYDYEIDFPHHLWHLSNSTHYFLLLSRRRSFDKN